MHLTRFKHILTLFFCLFAATVLRAQGDENPVSWSVSARETETDLYEITFRARIAAPWHMYDLGPYEDGPNATSFTFTPDERIELIGTVEQKNTPQRTFDEVFGMEIGYFDTQAEFVQQVRIKGDGPATLQTTVEWMACDDQSCLPPAEQELSVVLKSSGTAESQVSASGASSESGSLWSAVIEAVLWGFAALLTPCVFPMVPMTVSFFMKNSGNPAKGRMMASLYGISIVALYTLPIAVIILITQAVGGDAVTADIFNWLATHWIPNVIFFLVFMVFAASFFGAFEITLPSKLVNKSDSQADKGGVIGVFFMALTLVLVSFSCTGPIVGSVLIKSTSGEIWAPVVTMLAFSVAFSLPFTLFAFFPSVLKKLPKSGGWLNSVKIVLGFLELALGLKFLSVADQTYHWGILDREIYLALWIAIFSLLGLYLLGKLRFAHDSDTPTVSVPRLLLAVVTFAFVVYLLPGMWGAPLKGLSGYLPPLETQDFRMGTERRTDIIGGADGPTSISISDGSAPKYSDFLHLPHGLEGFFDFAQAQEYARKANKPLFVDYTGHGCVNCREMEARVWSDPQVLELLRNEFVIVALYSDDKKILPESDWVTTESGKVLKSLGKINAHFAHKRFGINSQPYYLILDDKGEQLVPGRGYNLDIEAFVDFLKTGLDKYRQSK